MEERSISFMVMFSLGFSCFLSALMSVQLWSTHLFQTLWTGFCAERYPLVVVVNLLARCGEAVQDPVRVQQVHVHGAQSSVVALMKIAGVFIAHSCGCVQ
jgi:hypothetical protein